MGIDINVVGIGYKGTEHYAAQPRQFQIQDGRFYYTLGESIAGRLRLLSKVDRNDGLDANFPRGFDTPPLHKGVLFDWLANTWDDWVTPDIPPIKPKTTCYPEAFSNVIAPYIYTEDRGEWYTVQELLAVDYDTPQDYGRYGVVALRTLFVPQWFELLEIFKTAEIEYVIFSFG